MRRTSSPGPRRASASAIQPGQEVRRAKFRSRDRGGFALIAALWLLVGLSAVGLHAALEMRTERLAAANRLAGARGREAAMAGAEYARSRLSAAMLDRADELRSQARSSRRGNRSRTQSVQALFRNSDPIDDPWRDPEELVAPDIVFGDMRFSLDVRDAAASLNLNAADAEMLIGFFAQGLGLDYALADRLAQAILDWRDEDELPRLGGAEREEYLRAGMAVLPPNRPFAEIDELRHVFGMTAEIAGQALPYLTLSGSGRINTNTAPGPVLLALPGMTPAIAQEIEALRASGTFPSSTEELLGTLSRGSGGQLIAVQRRLSARATYRTNEVEIISVGQVDGGPSSSRVRLVVTRSDQGAVVVSRALD